MQPSDGRLRVPDILFAVVRIDRCTLGIDRAELARDEQTIETVCIPLAIVGEAASNAPQTIQARAVAIPWRRLRAMLDITAYECFGIDVSTVWQTATVDVPALRPLLESLLSG